VLVKPFEPQIVISRVKELLAGRQPPGMWGNSSAAQGPVRQAPPPPRPSPATGNRPAASGDSLEAYFDHLDAAFSAAGTGDAPPAPFAPAAAARRETVPLARPRPVDAAQGRSADTTAAAKRDPLGDWDPDLHGDPARPAVVEPPIAFPQRANVPDARSGSAGPIMVPPAQAAPFDSAPSRPLPAPTAAQPSAPMPASLVDAFAALLAAEQKMGLAPSAATVPNAAPSPAGPSTSAALPTEDMIEEVSRRVLARLTDQSRPTILDVAERLVREEIDRIKQSRNL
jgi:hypothetical protein